MSKQRTELTPEQEARIAAGPRRDETVTRIASGLRSSTFVRDVRPERRVVACYTRLDGWKIIIQVERVRPDAKPSIVIRTFEARHERGGQCRVLLDEMADLEDAIAIARAWGAR